MTTAMATMATVEAARITYASSYPASFALKTASSVIPGLSGELRCSSRSAVSFSDRLIHAGNS
jgi:hypothetical protein